MYIDYERNIEFEEIKYFHWLQKHEWYQWLPRLDCTLQCRSLLPAIQHEKRITSNINGIYYPSEHTMYLKDDEEAFGRLFCHEWCHAMEMFLLGKINSSCYQDYRIGLFAELYDMLTTSTTINPFHYMHYTKERFNGFAHSALSHSENTYNIHFLKISEGIHERNNPQGYFRVAAHDGYYALPNEILARTLQYIPYFCQKHPSKVQEINMWFKRLGRYIEDGTSPLQKEYNGLLRKDLGYINTMFHALEKLEKDFNVISGCYSAVLYSNTKSSASPTLNFKYDVTPLHIRARLFNRIYTDYKEGILSEDAYKEELVSFNI